MNLPPFTLFSRTMCIAGLIMLSAAGKAQTATRPITPVTNIEPTNAGEFIRISGTIAEYIPPPEPRAPHAFILQDKAGDKMRVVAWRDIFERIDNHDALKTTGTKVTLTAEVVEYNEKIEIHVADWEEIDVTPSADDAPTSGSDAALTATLAVSAGAPVISTTATSAVTSQPLNS